jgi:hypothetical protein
MMDHPTTTPEQAQTDEFAVFSDTPGRANLELLGRVEVPTHSEPTADGERLTEHERLALAVHRAVTAEDTFVPDAMGNEVAPEELTGEVFMVMTGMDDAMEFCSFTQNPPVDAWEPDQ